MIPPADGPGGTPEELVPDRPGPDDPGTGRRLGIDVGAVRVGVASCDPLGILATPVETVPRYAGKGADRADSPDVRRVVAIAEEYEAVEIIVGLPRTLRGRTGESALKAAAFAGALREALPGTPVRLADERLSTVTATRALRESGVRARSQRAVIDQAAAVAILQSWLDERRAGPPEGAEENR